MTERMITKEMIEAVAWSPSHQEGMPWGMILDDKAIENILSIGLANCAALTLPSAGEAVEEGAKLIAAWINYAWDGLPDQNISDRFPDWAYNGIGTLHMNGGKPALRKLAARILALASPSASEAQCCMCGKKGLSTIEGDGGTECELTDGRWVCSGECWDRAVDPGFSSEARVRVKPLEWRKDRKAKALGATWMVWPYSDPLNDGLGNWLWQVVDVDRPASGRFHTEPDAKAAAQADYERRILSALSTPEQGETPPSPSSHVVGEAMLNIAKLAGEYNIRYQTNAAMQGFLDRILSDYQREWKEKLDHADHLQRLFDQQWKRSREAHELWRQAHPGNELVNPDLGELLAWLMSFVAPPVISRVTPPSPSPSTPYPRKETER